MTLLKILQSFFSQAEPSQALITRKKENLLYKTNCRVKTVTILVVLANKTLAQIEAITKQILWFQFTIRSKIDWSWTWFYNSIKT